MAHNDALLLDRWFRKHDAQAFRELVERYSRMVYGTACRILQSPDHADDVTQDCFLKLAQASKSRPRRIGSWLHRVATNRSISLLRSEKRRQTLESSRAAEQDGVQESSWEEVESWIDEAIERLPSEHRIPLTEHFLFGRTHESIARDAGVTRKAVAYRIRMGIESVQKFLRARGHNTKASLIAGGLATLIASQAAALPEALSMSLGKMSLGGYATAAGATGMQKVLVAAVISAVLVVGGFFYLNQSSSTDPDPQDKGNQAAAVKTSNDDDGNNGSPVEKTPAPQKEDAGDKKKTEVPKDQKPAVETVKRMLAGMVVDTEGAPVAGAEVFMALHPIPESDDPIWRENMLKADYWQRNQVHVAATGEDGRFAFDDMPEKGRVSLLAFKEKYYGKQERVTLEDKKPYDDLKLILTPGQLLRGVVLSEDSAAIPGAVVSIYHSYNKKGYAGYSGFTMTDEDGRFALAIHPEASHLTLRVNAAEVGQQFFTEVPVGPDEVELRFQTWCTVRGNITWSDQEPAEGVRVCITANVPEPQTLMRYSGWRLSLDDAAEVGADGAYEITGLHPGFNYDIYVVDPKKNTRDRRLHPLSPRWKNRFTLKPGETKTWDYALTRMIRIQGRILTAITKTPQPRLDIGVFKDGKYQSAIHCEANAKGEYDLQLNQGPGEYRITATPNWGMDGVTKAIAKEFGQTFTFEGGEQRQVDLEIYEPVQLPILVLDSAGNPVKSIRAKVQAKLSEEKRSRFSLDSSYALDDEGRHTFKLYHPCMELTLEVGGFPEGLKKKLGPFSAEPGTVLPEQTVTLYPTCDLTGIMVNAAGEPLAKESVKVQARFGDGIRDQFYVQTREDGSFEKKGRLRAASVTLKMFVGKKKTAWDSGPLTPVEGETLSLGEIIAPE